MTVTRILSTILIPVLAVVFGLSGTATALSESTDAKDAIVFSRQLGLWPANIWRTTVDGTYKRQLTYLGGVNPVWSPNGEKLVFTNPLSQRLQVMGANGAVNNLTPRLGHLQESSPSWSSDGKRLAFVREQQKSGLKEQAIVIVNADGSNEILAADWSSTAKYSSPSWSPDGRYIVYEKAEVQGSSLYVADLTLHTARLLTKKSDSTANSLVSWSPSGKKILYNDSDNEIYTIWPDGTHRSTIADGDSYDASWSPDGRKIVFLESHSGEGVSISSSDGTVTQLLVEQGQYESIEKPIWSPDSQSILFAMTDSSAPRPTQDLFVLSLRDSHAMIKVAHRITGGYDW